MAPSFDFLNIHNNLLQTALHLAVIMSLKRVVHVLKNEGADMSVTDHRGDTPLHIACREGLYDIATILLNHRPTTPERVTDYQLPTHQSVNDLQSRNYDGFACVHLAASGLNFEMLLLLLKCGADINVRDGKCGRTVLHYAAESGNEQLLTFLLQIQKIDLNCRAYNGQTPISLALARGFHATAVKLAQAGAYIQPTVIDYGDSDSDDDEMVGIPPYKMVLYCNTNVEVSF